MLQVATELSRTFRLHGGKTGSKEVHGSVVVLQDMHPKHISQYVDM
jgi:hypothetical protein